MAQVGENTMTNILIELQKQCKGLSHKERQIVAKNFIQKYKDKHYKICRFVYYTIYLWNRDNRAISYRKSKKFKHDNALCLKYLYKDSLCSNCGKPIPYERYKNNIFSLHTKIIKQCSQTCHQTIASKAGIKAQTPESRAKALEKSKATMLKRYGYTSALASPELREKGRQTMLKKYGVEHILQNPIIKAKAVNSYKQKMLDPITKESIMLKRKLSRQKTDPTYGTKGRTKKTSQDRSMPKHAYGKTYRFNVLGKIFECQSKTESNFVEWLVLTKNYELNDIISQFDTEYNNFVFDKIKTFPDFYIKSKNVYIEVKSIYTLLVGLSDNSTFTRNQEKAKRSITKDIIVRWVVGGSSKKYGKNHFVLLPKDWYVMTKTQVITYLKKHGLTVRD